MPRTPPSLQFVLDEHLRGQLFYAIVHHRQRSPYPLDVECVGDPLDLRLGSSDPAILSWAERTGRILLSFDRNTMPVRRALAGRLLSPASDFGAGDHQHADTLRLRERAGGVARST